MATIIRHRNIFGFVHTIQHYLIIDVFLLKVLDYKDMLDKAFKSNHMKNIQ